MGKEQVGALPRSTPEAQGIPSGAVRSFVEDVIARVEEMHGFMLVRHGHVVAEGWWAPYEAGRPHMLFSLSKSFTSTAAGLAVSEGRFSLDDQVVAFFPDDLPDQVSDNLAAMKVRHLLSMSTGHAEDTIGFLTRKECGNWARAFLARPVEHEPGTHFLYNSGATYIVSAIVQKTTGMTVLDYLRPRLFEPLGIQGATWESCPQGINTGGWGLSVKTEDIAKFGQLYVQDGVWQGKRILPNGWVAEATRKHVSNGDDPNSEWAQGYGFQFWRCRHNAYRGDGAFGQYCVVMPEQDAVLAITSGLGDMQYPLNLVWERLLTAMRPEPLPEDARGQEALCRRLAGLSLRAPAGKADSPTAARVSGTTYAVESNDRNVASITVEFDAEGCTFRQKDDRGQHSIACGLAGSWRHGTTTISPLGAAPYAATGAWSDENTFVMKQAFVETPFCPLLTLEFEGDQLTADLKVNVGFGPTEMAPLVGRVK